VENVKGFFQGIRNLFSKFLGLLTGSYGAGVLSSLPWNILIIAQDLLFVKGFSELFLFFSSESHSSMSVSKERTARTILSPWNNYIIAEFLL
jgi:hypothetical protein